jgi:hypothetical protein
VYSKLYLQWLVAEKPPGLSDVICRAHIPRCRGDRLATYQEYHAEPLADHFWNEADYRFTYSQ